MGLCFPQVGFPHTAQLGRLPGTNVFRNVKQYPEAQQYPGILAVRIDAPLYYANVPVRVTKAEIHTASRRGVFHCRIRPQLCLLRKYLLSSKTVDIARRQLSCLAPLPLSGFFQHLLTEASPTDSDCLSTCRRCVMRWRSTS